MAVHSAVRTNNIVESRESPKQDGNKNQSVSNSVEQESFGAFLKSVKGRSRNLSYISSPMQIRKTAMGEESGLAGGYLVPQDYTASILKVISEESWFYSRANKIPMKSREILCPKIDVETVQSSGVSPFFGGITFTWGSSQAPAETEPTFRMASLTAWDLLGYAVISNQLLDDMEGTSDEYLINLFGKAATWYLEYALLNGAGTASSMPLGILNSAAGISVTRAAGNQIAAADIAGLAAKLLPFSWVNSVWACNPSSLAQITKLANYQLNAGFPAHPHSCGFLLGRPLIVTDKLPALGTRGDLILFDPSLYLVGMRSEVLVDLSRENRFSTNQSVFRIWLRAAGEPQVSKAITLSDASTTVSPYVVLN